MNWDDLRIFLTVAREGSISGAAKRLEVQHSTVSRRVRSLEDQLGTRLIERKPSGYELTGAGEDLKISAGRIEMEVLELDGALGDHESRVSGSLRVSAINNMASTVLMPMFARFSQKYPDIEFHVQVSNKYVSLAERHADIVIRLTNKPLETLIGTRLTTVSSAVYGERDYVNSLLEKGRNPKWLGVECCEFHKTWTDATCPDHDYDFITDDTLLTLSAVKQGLGLAYLPCFMGDSAATLQRYRQPEPQHDLGLWLLYHPDMRRIKRVRLFREHMIEQVQEQHGLFGGEKPMHNHSP